MVRTLDEKRSQRNSADADGLLGSPVRRGIVDLLAAGVGTGEHSAVGLTAAELGERLGLHVTTVRFHLDQLVHVGVLSTDLVRGRVGRPRKIYSLPPAQQVRTAGDAHAALSLVLAEAWPADGDDVSPREAGRRWVHRHLARRGPVPPRAGTPGEWLGKLGTAFDMFVQWGYQPELRTSDHGRTAELTLRDCPFLDMAATRPDVVCGVHHGLVCGAMEMAGEPSVDVVVQPFVTSRTCTVQITQGREDK